MADDDQGSNGVLLPVKVKPNARTTAVTGWDGDTVCIAVAAPRDGNPLEALCLSS